MENPEEVLQALDEFQKLRPAEIPRELEDYLSFVAKTGDPVYQWSLIKPLFREKLVRVMTDLHESCPTLELAPSPNIEQFNYDSMKGNLLDLLESFANAPFTVQRICELLTSPRKEYNRVDKFMRAIEKNILVVSTREPGPPAARRSENGDSMINGNLDDESSVNQPSHEVEMESWVKDCTTDNVSLSNDHLLPIAEPISAKLPKDEDVEKPEQRADINNFIATTELVNTIQPENCPVVEVAGIAGDVPEAIMNEDTSSQPSLDSESDDNETTKKLQTTFQSRDFVSKDKVGKFYEEKSENVDKLKENEETESKLTCEHSEETDEPMEKRQRLDDSAVEAVTVVNPEESLTKKEETEVKVEEKTEEQVPIVEEPTSKPITETENQEFEAEKEAETPKEAEESKEKVEDEAVSEVETKPIVEEPEENSIEAKGDESIIIQEAMEDDAKTISTIVPDPIPIVEEPKEESAPTNIEDPAAEEIVNVPSPQKEAIVEEKSQDNIEETCKVSEPVVSNETIPVVVEAAVDKIQPESMEVDSEESISVLNQDEPMEEESRELKS